MTAPAPGVSPEIKALMRRLKLGQLCDTLPERLALARTHHLSHADFLEQLLSDEVSRRDASSAGLRAHRALLDPTMVLEAWEQAPRDTPRAPLGLSRCGEQIRSHCATPHQTSRGRKHLEARVADNTPQSRRSGMPHSASSQRGRCARQLVRPSAQLPHAGLDPSHQVPVFLGRGQRH